MEFQGGRDDSVPVDPDIIDIAIWPAVSTRDNGVEELGDETVEGSMNMPANPMRQE